MKDFFGLFLFFFILSLFLNLLGESSSSSFSLLFYSLFSFFFLSLPVNPHEYKINENPPKKLLTNR